MTNTSNFDNNSYSEFNQNAADNPTTPIPAVEATAPQVSQAAPTTQTVPNAQPAQTVAATPENTERKKTILHIATGFIAAAILITPTTWMIASNAAQNSGPGMSQMGQMGQGGPSGQMGGQGGMNGQSDSQTDGQSNSQGNGQMGTPNDQNNGTSNDSDQSNTTTDNSSTTNSSTATN